LRSRVTAGGTMAAASKSSTAEKAQSAPERTMTMLYVGRGSDLL
jgi:hypothetical protein